MLDWDSFCLAWVYRWCCLRHKTLTAEVAGLYLIKEYIFLRSLLFFKLYLDQIWANRSSVSSSSRDTNSESLQPKVNTRQDSKGVIRAPIIWGGDEIQDKQILKYGTIFRYQVFPNYRTYFSSFLLPGLWKVCCYICKAKSFQTNFLEKHNR